MADRSATLTVTAGAEFQVSLGAAPGSTGHEWTLVEAPGAVQPLGRDFAARGLDPGAGGVQVFRLRALEPGRYRLRFELKRRWERAPVDTHTLELEVLPP